LRSGPQTVVETKETYRWVGRIIWNESEGSIFPFQWLWMNKCCNNDKERKLCRIEILFLTGKAGKEYMEMKDNGIQYRINSWIWKVYLCCCRISFMFSAKSICKTRWPSLRSVLAKVNDWRWTRSSWWWKNNFGAIETRWFTKRFLDKIVETKGFFFLLIS